MANNKNRNDVKKNASTLNSGWLKNTLKSMGVASTEMIKDIMPATGETLHSAGELTNDAIKTVRSTRVGARTLADSISKSSAVKMSQDFFKNALEDIKSGNLYNTERERPLDGFDDSDMDMETLFRDMDDFSFDEEGWYNDGWAYGIVNIFDFSTQILELLLVLKYRKILTKNGSVHN